MLKENSGHNPGQPGWRKSEAICALADGERHLGHIVQIGGRWHAFDGTRLNDESNGFRFIGSFASATAARQGVEQSLGLELASLAGAA